MGKLALSLAAPSLAALSLVACVVAPGSSVATPAATMAAPSSAPGPAPSAIGALPDARSLAALATKLDASCTYTCCLPKPEWTRSWAKESSPAATQAARDALATTKTPTEATLALRVLSHGATTEDSAKVAAFVDDVRPGPKLPEEHLSQAWRECYPVSWKLASPSSEALRILGNIHAATFATAADYRAWTASHLDPEHSFEVWSARLSRQEPPPNELVAKLRATDPELFVTLMLDRCRGDDRCGVSVSELNTAVKTQLGVARVMRWLDGSEPVPYVASGSGVGETYANLLRGADVIFGPAERPALTAIWNKRRLLRTTAHALLALYLARVDPSSRLSYLRDALQRGAQELERPAVALALREASRSEPVALEREIDAWFVIPSSLDQSPETAIFEGLAASGRKGAPVLGRLLQRPMPALTMHAALALHQAGTVFGCPNLVDPSTMKGYPSKGQSRAEQEQNVHAAAAQRAALALAMRACAPTLAKPRP